MVANNETARVGRRTHDALPGPSQVTIVSSSVRTLGNCQVTPCSNRGAVTEGQRRKGPSSKKSKEREMVDRDDYILIPD